MRILCVHNYYGSSAPSGENVAYQDDVALLRSRGHEVAELTSLSDDLISRGFIGKIQGAVSCSFNFSALHKINASVRKFVPDVVHFHNLFPRISPAVIRVRGRSLAKVATLHNYRVFCSAGTATRAGSGCRECLDKDSVLPAIRYSCYRDSVLATLPVATMIGLHKRLGTWRQDLDAIIALTEFQRDLLIAGNLVTREKLYVRSNFMPGVPRPSLWADRENVVLYVGRLSEEKGVEVLAQAWAIMGAHAPKLVLIGDGPLRKSMEERLADLIGKGTVTFAGQLPPTRTLETMSRSKLLLIPSVCFEGFPMVIREAFSLGVPIVASRIGALPRLIENAGCGVTSSVGDAEDLAKTVNRVWRNDQALQEFSRQARQAYEQKYSEDAAYTSLMNIYDAAIKSRALKYRVN